MISRLKGLLAAACAALMMLCSAQADAASYSITTGDLLSIYVYRQEDMNVKVRVDNSGFIRFPIAGRIQVIGKTPSQIEGVIASALSRNGFASPEVVVSVDQYAPRKVFVLGEVNTGSDFSCNIPEGGEMTAMQALSAAGGLAPSADTTKIVVRRFDAAGKAVMLKVPARDILAGKAVADIQLVPGDTVVVPKALPVSVLGTVKKPGEFYGTPDQPLTVSRAIALAGGAERPKSLSKIRVARGDKSFLVDIQSLLEEGTGGGDMTLEPGDVVYVPETRW
ncbi:MAG: polysaccharide export protein [Mailhella sp.]|nr:polysaccharide export protein [Mailhella sp.]